MDVSSIDLNEERGIIYDDDEDGYKEKVILDLDLKDGEERSLISITLKGEGHGVS